MQTRPFADDLADDEVFDDVCRPDRAIGWLNEATMQAGQMPDDYYIHNIVRHWLYDLSKADLLQLLFCIELRIPYRDYLSFADKVDCLFTENDPELGARMAVNYKVRSAIRGYVANKFCFL